MSERFQHPRDNAQPTDYRADGLDNASEARPADHSSMEPKLVVSGAAFQSFEVWIDQQLDELVGRWIQTAAPAAATMRRVVPQASRREQA